MKRIMVHSEAELELWQVVESGCQHKILTGMLETFFYTLWKIHLTHSQYIIPECITTPLKTMN